MKPMLTLKSVRKPETDKIRLPRGLEQYWNLEQINDVQYIIRLKDSIVQTGAEFNSDFLIPFHHRVMEMAVYHYTAAGALSTDTLTFKWYVRDGANWRIMWNKSAVTYSSFNVRYQDEVMGGTDLNPTTYRFTTNTTATDLIAVSVRLEVLKW